MGSNPLKKTIRVGFRTLGYHIQGTAHFEAERRAYAQILEERDAALQERDAIRGACEAALKERDALQKAYDAAAAARDEFEKAYRREVTEKTRCALTPQVAFMHIMKTAGISVQMFLKPFYEDSRSLWVESSEQIEPLHPHYLQYFDLINGHFSYKDAAKLRDNRRLVSVVRDPVDRLLSAYWYFRKRQGSEIRDLTRFMIDFAKRYSFLDWLKCDHPQVRSVTHNQQTYAFAHDWRAPREGDGDGVLRAALTHLDDFFFVGMYERLEEGLRLLCEKMGWRPAHALERYNVTTRRQSVAELSAAERDAALDCNQLDLALYDHARRRLEEELAANQAPG